MTISARGITLGELGLDSAAQVSTTVQRRTSPNKVTETASFDSEQKLYDILQGLLIALSPEHSLDEMLRCLATLSRQATAMDLCVVMLLESVNGQMTMQASSPDLHERGVIVVPPGIDQYLWAKLSATSSPGQLPTLSIHEQEQLNPLKNVQYETLVVGPLIARNDCI